MYINSPSLWFLNVKGTYGTYVRFLTIFHVGFISSNMKEIISKFAQLSPQERAKRLENIF
jgi:hypothetical protein